MVVERVDHEARLIQPLGHVLVAAHVLPVSVRDRDDALERLVARWRPALPDDATGAGTPEAPFLAGVDGVSLGFHGSPPRSALGAEERARARPAASSGRARNGRAAAWRACGGPHGSPARHRPRRAPIPLGSPM